MTMKIQTRDNSNGALRVLAVILLAGALSTAGAYLLGRRHGAMRGLGMLGAIYALGKVGGFADHEAGRSL